MRQALGLQTDSRYFNANGEESAEEGVRAFNIPIRLVSMDSSDSDGDDDEDEGSDVDIHCN